MQSPSSLREDVPSTSSVAESSEPQAHTAWVAPLLGAAQRMTPTSHYNTTLIRLAAGEFRFGQPGVDSPTTLARLHGSPFPAPVIAAAVQAAAEASGAAWSAAREMLVAHLGGDGLARSNKEVKRLIREARAKEAALRSGLFTPIFCRPFRDDSLFFLFLVSPSPYSSSGKPLYFPGTDAAQASLEIVRNFPEKALASLPPPSAFPPGPLVRRETSSASTTLDGGAFDAAFIDAVRAVAHVEARQPALALRRCVPTTPVVRVCRD